MPSSPSLQRRLIHWVSGALVLIAAGAGLWMVRVPDAQSADGFAKAVWWFSLHKTLGLVLLVLSLWRLVAMWRDPFAAADGKPNEVLLAGFAQGFMICALVLLPVLGLAQHALVKGSAPIWLVPLSWQHWTVAAPETSRILATCHRLLAWGFISVLVLHLAGAIKQHFIARSGVVLAMIQGGATGKSVRTANPVLRMAGLSSGLFSVLALVLVAALLPSQWDKKANPVALPGTPQPRTPWTPWTWAIDPKRSTLTILASHDGQAFTAAFPNFNAAIVLDPSKPEYARIDIAIDTGKFSSGLPDRDRIATGNDWLAAERYPLARWTSTTVSRQPDGSFVALGRLTIRDTSASVPVHFTLSIDNNKAMAKGTASFNRKALKLGRGEYASLERAKNRIDVRIHIEATRKQ